MSAKKTIKWNDSIMTRFLELYQQHECLWNNSSGAYKNRDARESAIQQIIIELNLYMTEADIKNKIKSIRTMYRRELLLIIKSKKSGAGSEDVYKPTLNWFNQADSFLRAVTIARESSSNLDIGYETFGDVETMFEGTSPITETTDTNEFVRPSASQAPSLQECETIAHKRKLDDINEAIDKLDKISSTKNEELDEFGYFGKFVTAQLRKMPEYDAILCQEEMHSVMRKYRLRPLTVPLSNAPPEPHLRNNLPSTLSPTQIYIKNEM